MNEANEAVLNEIAENFNYKEALEKAKQEGGFHYTDCMGNPFKVIKCAEEGVWTVVELGVDPFGTYEREVDDVDDCDTEEEAVIAWQERQKANEQAYLTMKEPD